MFETTEIKDIKEGIGEYVKTIRKLRKLSQSELAALLSVSRTTIQNLEAGNNFTVDTLLKVMKEFDLLDQLNKHIQDAKQHAEATQPLY